MKITAFPLFDSVQTTLPKNVDKIEFPISKLRKTIHLGFKCIFDSTKKISNKLLQFWRRC